MPIIEWDESMAAGVAEIDAQHQELARIINQVFDAYQAGGDRPALEKAVRRFCDYTQAHFALEEGLMERHGYPDCDRHVAEHMDCREKAIDFFTEYIEGGDTLTGEVLDYLAAWFRSHTTGTDRPLGRFLNSRGVH
ncbi:MAG: bacteriohemerythrin [Thermodesulfobacteriota bacterium]